MASKFGLEELEQLQAQMKVGRKEAKTIKLIGAVTGLPIAVVSDVKEAITSARSAVEGLLHGVEVIEEQDKRDEADTNETVKQLRVARSDRKEGNRRERERMTYERGDNENRVKRLEGILKNFA